MIGRDGQLPWRLSTDLKRFRSLTMGRPIIMGRKTFQSLGKPLDGRDNIVVTRDPGFSAEGALVANSLDAALSLARDCAAGRGVDEVLVIGGADIFRQAIPLADRIYLTRVHAAPPGDIILDLPDFDTLGALEISANGWARMQSEQWPSGPRDEYAATFSVFSRTPGTYM